MQNQTVENPWYKVENILTNGSKTVEVFVYGEIKTQQENETDVEAKKFLEEVSALEPFDNLVIHINSPGGNPFQAMAIVTALETKKYKVTVCIDGLAASAATILATIGKAKMACGGLYMIHQPTTSLSGGAESMRKTADMLDKISETLAKRYSAKTGIQESDILEMMQRETWMNAEEALAKGFVDEIVDFEVAACISDDKLIINNNEFDVTGFKNCPKLPKAIQNKNIKHKEEKTVEIKSLEDLKNSCPDILAQAQTEWTRQQQERIVAFREIENTVDKVFLNKCMDDGLTAQETLFKAHKEGKTINAVENKKAEDYLNNAKSDSEATKKIETDANTVTEADNDTTVLGSVKNFFTGGKK